MTTLNRLHTLIPSLGLVLGAAFLAGCPSQSLKPLTPCVVSGTVNRVAVTNVDKVDLLFLVDNSKSMLAEQEQLSLRVSDIVNALTTGNIDDDLEQEFDPVADLHVAVISSDMGAGDPQWNDECDVPEGDDGRFITNIDAAVAECADVAAPDASFLQFDGEAGDVPQNAADLSDQFSCIVASLGIEGCGFERQLDAVIKALVSSTADVEFNSGSAVGRGDTDNAGFLRPDSLLGVVVVSDEDDCSTTDLNLFDPGAAQFNVDGQPNMNLRCADSFDILYPFSRYSDALLDLRPNPDLLVFALLSGVPPDLVAPGLAPTAAEILEDERMANARFEENPTLLRPSCQRTREVDGQGNPLPEPVEEIAYPPRRMVRVAGDIEAKGGNGVIQSICQDDFTPAITAITRRLADVLGASCLERAQTPDQAGLVNCDVIEILPAVGDVTRCADLEPFGRDPNPVRVEDGREVCRINQIAVDRNVTPPAVAGGEGWYYDDFSDDTLTTCTADSPQRISFTENAAPRLGSNVRLECLSRAQSSIDPVSAKLGQSCSDNATCEGPGGFFCDPKTGSCQRECASDADCTDLGSFVCDTRRDAEGFPRVCVNDTCSAQ